MNQDEDRALELVELGSVTADTQGDGGPVIEFFIGMTKTGLIAE